MPSNYQSSRVRQGFARTHRDCPDDVESTPACPQAASMSTAANDGPAIPVRLRIKRRKRCVGAKP